MTDADKELKQYVEQMAKIQHQLFNNGWLYRGVEDIVAAIGVFDIAQKLPKGIRRGKARLCFMNAFRLMGNGYTYVEGIALPATTHFPVHHSWCVDKSNNVIDPTWTDGVAYLGIHMNESFVYNRVLRRGKYGVLGDVDAFDLYKDGFPQDALL
ncbi:MAG: hypothetical protein M0R50_03330 [Candidatus Cloacimonetes bacterium]|jgi:hypothetical protein|nr:hypothetical protein [Candidatus Cloacimonadota bacterium]